MRPDLTIEAKVTATNRRTADGKENPYDADVVLEIGGQEVSSVRVMSRAEVDVALASFARRAGEARGGVGSISGGQRLETAP